MKPDFDFEKKYWDKGYVVVGVDEVGKGAVAGPIVATAVAPKFSIFNFSLDTARDLAAARQFSMNLQCSNFQKIRSLGIDDSKRLTRKRREELEPRIKKYFYWGIGEAGVGEINKLGIVVATRRAMKRAIRKLPITNYQLPKKFKFQNFKFLIDGRRVRGIGNQVAIVKGDQKSISIAAASILAKVYRDKLMRDLSGKYRGYGFERHVGYGTKYHAEMLKKLGMCEIHRVGFVRSLLKITNFQLPITKQI